MTREIPALRLGDIICHLDRMAHVRIISGEAEEEEELFNGFVMDIPWTLLEHELMTTGEWEAISVEHYIDDNTVQMFGFVICVKEDWE